MCHPHPTPLRQGMILIQVGQWLLPGDGFVVDFEFFFMLLHIFQIFYNEHVLLL